METISGTKERSPGSGVDLRALEEGLQRRATRLAAQSQIPSPEALDCLRRSATLQLAAFVVRSEIGAGDVGVRDSSA